MIVFLPLYFIGALGGGYVAWIGTEDDRRGVYTDGEFIDYFMCGAISLFAALLWPLWLPWYGIYTYWRLRNEAR